MTSPAQNPTLSELLSSRALLVLSPHMDDAMLSASSLVLDHPCDVWTVFTGAPKPPRTTSWDLSCGFPDSDATIAARKGEDARAFEGTEARTRHLDALEGAYATREEHRAALPTIEAEIDAWMSAHPHGLVVAPACAGLHMPPPPWTPALAAVASARSAVRRLATQKVAAHETEERHGGVDSAPSPETPAVPEARTDASARQPAQASGSDAAHVAGRVARTAVVPLKRLVQRALHAEHLHRRRRTMGEDGLAANPDHLALRDATLRVARRHPGIQVALFEDLPYLWHARGDDEVTRLERATGWRFERVRMPVDVTRKHAHLSHYVSQLPVLDRRGRLLEASNLPDHEVFWLGEPR